MSNVDRPFCRLGHTSILRLVMTCIILHIVCLHGMPWVQHLDAFIWRRCTQLVGFSLRIINIDINGIVPGGHRRDT